MSSTVHVVRHGEVHNPQKILYGRQPGWTLSDRGHKMAATLGDWSKQIDLGALHVSPLQRAQETAAPIAAAHNIKITTDERLIIKIIGPTVSRLAAAGIWLAPRRRSR